MDGIQAMDVLLRIEMFPVEVRGAEEVVMGEEECIGLLQGGIEAGGAVDPAGSAAGLDAVGGMLDAEGRLGIEPGHFRVYGRGHDPEAGRAFLCGEKVLPCRSAEGATVGMKTYHVETADEADVLLFLHQGPPRKIRGAVERLPQKRIA
jgi:hypothetical protein